MLLVTPGREDAIENIRRAAAEGRFNDKTEPFDPEWDPSALKENILQYTAQIDSPLQRVRRAVARAIVDGWIRKYSDGVNEIEGLEKLLSFDGPAFVTANHFNPFDNGLHRTLARKAGRGRLTAISQGTNFVMGGINGFVLRNIDVIPLIGEPSYMNGPFKTLMRRSLDAGQLILIYPEQEMWYNYRKPRPGKRGAFLFAAEYGVPVVPTFTELLSRETAEASDFRDIKLILHVLDPIFPDPSLSARENSFRMARADYLAKVACYERVYGKPLDYAFTPWDIAGWNGRF